MSDVNQLILWANRAQDYENVSVKKKDNVESGDTWLI